MNAEGYYSTTGDTIHIALNVSKLPRSEQLSMLRDLMTRTGILATIVKHDTDNTLMDKIDETWEIFRTLDEVR